MAVDPYPQKRLADLRNIVKLLSSPAEVQISWLKDKGFDGDELVASFDDVWPQWKIMLRNAATISERQIEALDSFRETLMAPIAQPGHGLSTDEAILTSSEWNAIRMAASQLLLELRE